MKTTIVGTAIAVLATSAAMASPVDLQPSFVVCAQRPLPDALQHACARFTKRLVEPLVDALAPTSGESPAPEPPAQPEPSTPPAEVSPIPPAAPSPSPTKSIKTWVGTPTYKPAPRPTQGGGGRPAPFPSKGGNNNGGGNPGSPINGGGGGAGGGETGSGGGQGGEQGGNDSERPPPGLNFEVPAGTGGGETPSEAAVNANPTNAISATGASEPQNGGSNSGPGLNNIGSPTPNSSALNSQNEGGENGPLTGGAKAGISVAAGLFGVALLATGLLIARRNRRDDEPPTSSTMAYDAPYPDNSYNGNNYNGNNYNGNNKDLLYSDAISAKSGSNGTQASIPRSTSGFSIVTAPRAVEPFQPLPPVTSAFSRWSVSSLGSVAGRLYSTIYPAQQQQQTP
ncbi:hypothetical protein HK104_006480, partial [Borealophlyctis nickersoniae]